MKTLKFATLCFAAVHFITAQAQENDTKHNTDRVEVSSYKGLELKSYSQMQKGLKAYAEYKKLAPNSELFFILIPKSQNISLDGLTMRLASDDASVNIPIDINGKFQLPDIVLKHEDEYDLILNKLKGQFYFKPLVKSANLSDDVKRIGDVRLECQVRWAVEKQDISIVFSAHVKLFANGNPCTSRYVNVMFFAPNGTDTVTLDTPQLKSTQKINANRQYALPIWNSEIIDDALVKYTQSTDSKVKQEN
jgi:hypothetical protein